MALLNLVPQGGSQKSLVLSVAVGAASRREVKVTHSKVLWNKLFRDFKWLLYSRCSVLDLDPRLLEEVGDLGRKLGY